MSRALILIDDKKHAENIRQILVSAGYEAERAQDEASCRHLLVKQDPDIAIIDITYGAALVSDIKRLAPELPVLGWLPSYDARSAVQFMRDGVFDCLCAPIHYQEVLDVFSHTIERFYGVPPAKKLSPVIYAVLRFGRMFLWGVALIALMFLAEIFIPKNPSVEKMNLPYEHPTAITWDGRYMWVSNWYTQTIYRYETIEAGLQLTGTYYFADFGPVAIARSGNNLWSAGNDLVMRKHILNDRLEIVQASQFSEYSPSGMSATGNTLWMCDAFQKKLLKYAVGDSLTLVYSYTCPLFSPAGISWQENTLWIGDARTDRIYLYRELGKEMRLDKIYQLPAAKSGQLAGFTLEGKWLYAIYAGKGASLTKYSIKDLKQVKEKGREYLAAAQNYQPASAREAEPVKVIKVKE